MKIEDVISEAPAGTGGALGQTLRTSLGGVSSKLGKKRADRKKAKQQKQLIDQNYKKWIATVKQKQKQGVEMTDENVYKKELYRFIGGAGKLKLGGEMRRIVGRTDMTEKSIKAILEKTIEARKAAKARVAQNQPTSAEGDAPAAAGAAQ